MKTIQFISRDRTGLRLWQYKPSFDRKHGVFISSITSPLASDGARLGHNAGIYEMLPPCVCIEVNVTYRKKIFDYSKTPEGKLLKSIFKNTPPKPRKAAQKDSMLLIHAVDRKEELQPMVDMLTANKVFPNDNYRKVFQWALMEAAQWQYEQIMNKVKTESKPII